MGIMYTYAIDRINGLTYVGKSKIQLESFGNSNFIRPKDVSLSECEVFETLDVVRTSKKLKESYATTITKMYEKKREDLGNPSMQINNPEISLENVVTHTLQLRKK